MESNRKFGEKLDQRKTAENVITNLHESSHARRILIAQVSKSILKLSRWDNQMRRYKYDTIGWLITASIYRDCGNISIKSFSFLVDCHWNDWIDDSSCSKTCGHGDRTGTKYQKRTKNVTEQNGGTCDNTAMRKTTCTTNVTCPSESYIVQLNKKDHMIPFQIVTSYNIFIVRWLCLECMEGL